MQGVVMLLTLSPIASVYLRSFIGKIKVNVNLFALFTKPITIQIDTVVLVLSTKPPNQWNPEEKQAVSRKFKERSLEAGQAAAVVSKFKRGFLWKMKMKLVKNMMVEIKNVHIRVEDFVSRKDRGCAMGKIGLFALKKRRKVERDQQ